ncbi:MAG: hypothetical protein JXA96_08930 [Sedimentisphaerales bacterium]|nr:hypothetical protein [Sedimentisphaerales bacterium]
MRNQRGLTVIEVVVVLFMIVLLVGILLPNINRPHGRSFTVMCLEQLKQLNFANMIYCDDNGRNFIEIEEASEQSKWLKGLKPYYSQMNQNLKCPSARKTRIDGKEYGGLNNTYTLTLEEEDSSISVESSYGINSWIYNPAPDSNIVENYPAENFWRSNDFPNVAQVPIFADSMWVGGFPEPNGIAGQPPDENGQWDSVDSAMKHFSIERHSSRTNVGFMDGHADIMKIKDLWKLKWHKNFDTKGPWTKPDAPWPEWMKPLR